MKSFNLIVPIAADKPVYNQEMPFVFSLSKEGIMFCIKAILGLQLNKFDKIYFTILKKHDELFCLSDLFKLQFKRLQLNNAKVVVLDEPTYSQPETIYKTIEKENIEGGVFIKDADCTFTCDIEPANGIAIYPLESLEWVNPQNKSYVSIDDMFYITNIIEKRIIDHYFCAGGYSFDDAKEYCKYFEKLKINHGLYLSHIVYAMLLNKKVFRPIIVKNYVDFEAK